MKTFSIGRVNFHVSCEPSLELWPQDSAYDDFVGRSDTGPGAVDIDVLFTGDEPELPGGSAKKVFDTNESWSLYRCGAEHLIALKPGDKGGKPAWTALCSRDFTRVRVSCAPGLRSRRNGSEIVTNVMQYPLDQILTISVLAGREGMIVHAAGATVSGKGLIFPGVSGAGKSTISRLLEGESGVELLSDDRMILRRSGEGWRAFGTPWSGEAGIAVNREAPLTALYFIAHGNGNQVRTLEPKDAVHRLLPVTSIPWYDREAAGELLGLCGRLVDEVPSYELVFTPDRGIGGVLRNLAERL